MRCFEILTENRVLAAQLNAPDAQDDASGDARRHEYVLTDDHDRVVAVAHPGYAEGEAPDAAGWPLDRMPLVDHADAMIGGRPFDLVMHSSQYYTLNDKDGNEVTRVLHKGLSGGWTIDDSASFPPEVLCGLFVFCRYIEEENEFLTV